MATDPSGLIAQLLSPQAIQGPAQAFADGQQQQLNRKLTALQIQQNQQKLAQDEQYQTDVSHWIDGGQIADLPKLIAMYPNQYQALKQTYDIMDEKQKQSLTTQFGQLYATSTADKPELAASNIDQIIKAEKNEGFDTTDAQSIADGLRSSDPAAVQAALGRVRNFAAGHLSAMSPKFAEGMGIGVTGDGHFKSSPLGIFDDRTGDISHPIGDKAQYRVVRNADGTTSIVQLGGAGDDGSASSLPPGVGAAATDEGGSASVSGNQPISVRLNNPGAIKFDPKNQWQGQVGQQGGFVQFDTPANGLRAQQKLIANQIRNGYNTPSAWAAHYSPASDGNDPAAYAKTIADGLGIGVNDPIPLSAVPKMAQLSAQVEAGGSPGNGAPSAATSQPTTIVGATGAARQPGVKVLYTSAPGKAGLDASTIDFYAQKVAAGGDMPQVGTGKDAAAMRQAILQRAAQIQQGQGMSGGDSNLLHADVKTATTALAGLQKTRNSLDPFIKTFDAASAQVRALAPQGVGGSIPIFNRWIQAGRRSISGDPAVSKFNVAINAVANENAKIMSGASGGAVTSDSARAEAMSLINNAMTLDQLNGVLDQMHTDSVIRMKSLDDRAADLRGIISGRGAGALGGQPPRPSASGKTAPQVGAVMRGFRFNGGNPADRNNWSKVQ